MMGRLKQGKQFGKDYFDTLLGVPLFFWKQADNILTNFRVIFAKTKSKVL
jgi:hypothetical protein